ncbi:GTP cyclohydrolase II [Candidatus Curtissbacteria bacterium]|nr:GTP cyclohydrolase II [Candidatus Curtissbacteria bacterium]
MVESEFSTLWKNPGLLIKLHKDILKARGESMAERLGQCPLPIRVHIPITLSQEQITTLGLDRIEGRPMIIIEKDCAFQMYVYGDKSTGEEHVAVIKGVGDGENVPIRIHSSCLTAETFHAANCDCHEQLQMALGIVEKEGFGGIIWLHQEGRGNGLVGKAKQLKIMLEEGIDTVAAFEKAGYPVDQRDYTVAADIIKDLGIKSVRLITNNPNKIEQIAKLGIKIVNRIPCEVLPANEIVRKDLQAKRGKLGHLLDI